ncbi:MAG: O-antigen ligase family protein [bacterium]
MNGFIRNVVVVHVAGLALAFSWIHGGTRAELLLPVIPWLAAFTLELLFIFPQIKSTETLSEARSRVCHALVRDPLFYAAIALTVLLVIPLFNVAGAPVFDEALKQWHNPTPPVAWLPSCVKANEHAVLLLWFPPVLIAALAAQHGLLKRGKRLLLEILCWNGAALALFGFVQLLTGAKSIFWGEEPFSYFFSTFGYPNFAGAFFTLFFALSTGLWFGRASVHVIGHQVGSDIHPGDLSFLEQHYLLVAVLLNFGAAITSLSRAAILLCGVAFLVLSAYIVFGVWQKAGTGGRVKVLAVIAITLFLIGLFFSVFAPEALKSEVAAITPTTVADRVSGRAYYHARVAKEIFRDHRVFGVGGWGYPHYVTQYLKPEELSGIQIQGGANVHNDSLQFLAEQGWVGFGLLLVCVALLVVPLFWQVLRFCRSAAGARTPPKPAWLYRLPAPVIGVFVGTSATVCHSMGDLPFRDPAIMIVWVLAFVCVSGFLPAERGNQSAVPPR